MIREVSLRWWRQNGNGGGVVVGGHEFPRLALVMDRLLALRNICSLEGRSGVLHGRAIGLPLRLLAW